jgi:hypothetical protein
MAVSIPTRRDTDCIQVTFVLDDLTRAAGNFFK